MNNQATKEILKPIERVASDGHHISSVFRDWVSLMLYSLMRDDDLYMEVMGRYKNDRDVGSREADYFAKAFSILMKWMRLENHDLLGDVYMEIAGKYSTKNMGQFFTPTPVCDAMAVMTVGEASKDPIIIADPACGSARCLISAAKHVNQKSLFVGVDLDTVCVRMSTLNCCFFNMNAIIFHGNSLEMKYHTAYRTSRTVIGGTVRQLNETEFEIEVDRMKAGLRDSAEKSMEKAYVTPSEPKAPQKQEQLALFEL